LRNFLNSQELLEVGRQEPHFFTRSRQLPFATLLAFLLSGIRGAVQAELDTFVASLANRAELLRVVSAQAFCKARHHLRADVFARINRHLLDLVEVEIHLPRWHGLRVVAADASTVRLTQQEKKVRTVIEAIAFGLFLPGLELCLACSLYPMTCNERQMLFEHLALLRQNDLLVLDRGYPSAWLAALLSQTRIPFCIRCDMASTFKVVTEFARSSLAEAVVTLPAPNRPAAADYECERNPTRVRLVRVVTPNAKSTILMTSLLDSDAYPAESFAALYHSRWRIEEAFKRHKHRLNLEHTSGLTWLAARQDFGAKAVCDNLNALAAWLAYDAEETDLSADCYKVNRTLTFNILKRLCGCWLLKALPSSRHIAAVFAEIARNLQRFRPGRQRPRPKRPKPHKSFAYKPGV
jgi:hypothetical protein